MFVSSLCFLGIFAWGAYILVTSDEQHHIAAYVGLAALCFGMVSWLLVSIMALKRRNHINVQIDSSGVSLPMTTPEDPDGKVFFPAHDILKIHKDESFRGRMLAIELRDGSIALFQARHYCSLDKFLSICKEHGLPV